MKPVVKKFLSSLDLKNQFIFYRFYDDYKTMIEYAGSTDVFLCNNKFVDYVSILLEMEEFTSKLNDIDSILKLSYIFYDSIKIALKNNINYNVEKASRVREELFFFINMIRDNETKTTVLLLDIQTNIYESELNKEENCYKLYKYLACDNEFLTIIKNVINNSVLDINLYIKIAEIIMYSNNLYYYDKDNSLYSKKIKEYDINFANEILSKVLTYSAGYQRKRMSERH